MLVADSAMEICLTFYENQTNFNLWHVTHGPATKRMWADFAAGPHGLGFMQILIVCVQI